MVFSLNTIGLFPGLTMPEAFSRMTALGYDTFEMWRVDRSKVREIKGWMDEAGVKLSTLCTNEFVLNDPANHDAYEHGLTTAIEDARVLDSWSLITQVGQDTGAPRAAQHDAIVKGLRRMAPILEDAGVTLLVEPLNDVKDHKGYYLTDSREGYEIIREVASPRVKLLFDVYHQVHMGEDVLDRIAEFYDEIGHYHVAGHPNRDEKIFGEFDYTPVFEYIKRRGGTAPVGLELFPKSIEITEALLRDLRRFV